MTDHDPNFKQTEKLRTNVRFSTDEYRQLQNDATVTGKSIPMLLKDTYFKHPPLAPLMSKDDQRAILGNLARIGNNINQIAKHLNSGFRAGFYGDIVEARKALESIASFLVRTYGSPRSA